MNIEDKVTSDSGMVFSELIGEAVHEINNLLVAISGYSQLGIMADDDSQHKDYFGKIQKCVEQAGGLSKDLLCFAKPSSGQHGDVNTAINTVLDFYKFKVEKGYAELECDVAKDLPNVTMSTSDLQLVLGNLVKNAFEAVQGHSSAMIRIGAEVCDKEIVLQVWNSHSHIESDVMAKIFQPFFTTKQQYSGTGLGLSMSRRLISQENGKIIAENDPDGGVVFKITLPCVSRIVVENVGSLTRRKGISGHKILIVDDDESVRGLMELTVGKMNGADVAACEDGESSLELIGKESFDAIVLDIRMPGMSGQEVFKAMPSQNKERVVFITGDTHNDNLSDFIDSNDQPLLFKPFDHDELIDALEKVIHQ